MANKQLTSNEKATLHHLAAGGDLFAQAYQDHEKELAALKTGNEGRFMVARCATTAPITLATTALTALDGVTPVAGDIVLVKNQASDLENGLYVASAAAWARLKDSNGADVMMVGQEVVVSEGTTLADTQWMLTTNAPIVVGTSHFVYALVVTSGVSTADLISTANGKGASLVGIEDSAGLITAVTVEAALAELVKYVPVSLADPGTGVAIPVTRSATVNITTAAAETNTLAIPTFLGQRLILNMNVRAVGDRVVTSAQRINQAANTIMTFGAVGDCIALEAILIGGALRWQVTANDGVALS